jgi:hypothetical protein
MEAINSIFQAGLYVGAEFRDGLVRCDFNRSYWELVERHKRNGLCELSEDTKCFIDSDFKSFLLALRAGLRDAGYNKEREFPSFASKLLHSSSDLGRSPMNRPVQA